MKNLTFIGMFLALFLCTQVSAKPFIPLIPQRDTTAPAAVKKDTVQVPVPLLQKTDTFKVEGMTFNWLGHLKMVHGHALVTGFKNLQGQWAAQPAVRYVNKKYRPFKRTFVPIQ